MLETFFLYSQTFKIITIIFLKLICFHTHNPREYGEITQTTTQSSNPNTTHTLQKLVQKSQCAKINTLLVDWYRTPEFVHETGIVHALAGC